MDYQHDLLFGIGVAPNARERGQLVAAAETADQLGLEIIGIQDHPYQPAFLDTWTLLSYIAGRTQRLRLFPDVLNVPLRPPAVLARSAAALDLLSDGRVELGLGAGGFLKPIAAMGGPRRSISENVDALDEAITILRSLWRPGPPVQFGGRYYELDGARPGPTPAHPIRIWIGSYKRRMLELTGRTADGWIPSVGYAELDDLGPMSRTIDEAARAAGRDPGEIRRGFNITGTFTERASGFLQGPATVWAEQLAALTVEHGMSAFILAISPDNDRDLRRFAEEVAPAVRELVGQERGHPSPEPAVEPAVREAAADVPRLAAEQEPVGEVGRRGQQTLLAVHQHLRDELSRLIDVITQVAEGRMTAAEARSYLNQMTMRQNYWTLGAFCAAYCRVVSVHHAIEDQVMFPDLKAADQSLAPILARLREEHEGIAHVLAEIDAALTAMIADERRLEETQHAVERLRNALLPHLQYEEDKLLEPIGRLQIAV